LKTKGSVFMAQFPTRETDFDFRFSVLDWTIGRDENAPQKKGTTMANEVVARYFLYWDTKASSGCIRVHGPNGFLTRIDVSSAGEFHALATMLRTVRPDYYDGDSGVLSTGGEITGEEES